MKRVNKKRKNKKKNKGFSMVEILAVVVILGVISTIGIVTISRLIDRSRIHYYETQEDQLVLAAQSYANDNKNILPKTVGEMNIITLKELREKNYIKEEIVDQHKNKCYEEPHKVKDKNGNNVTLEGSRVEIYKSTKTDYVYNGYLECDACVKAGDTPTSCYTSETKKEPSINIDIPNLNSNSNTILDKSHKIKITIKGHATDTNIRVASYSYKIYQDNVVKYTSGLKINNKKPTITITDELYKYVPGKVKVVVSATNSDGISKSATKTVDLKDFKSPKCGRVSYDPNNQMTSYNSGASIKCGQPGYSWIGLNNATGSRQAWIICNDEFGQGCAQHEYSVNMVKEGENEIVALSDKTGNQQSELDKCTVKKCIDKTTPKIVVRVYKGTSSNDKTGNAIYTYDKPVSTTAANYTVPQEKNNTWLNKGNFPNGVYVEVTVSDPLSKLKKYTWYQNVKNQKENATLTPNQKVEEKTWTYNQSGNNSYTKGMNITDDGVRIEKIQVWDQANNSTTYNLILKIDRTAPSTPTTNLRKWSTNTEPRNERGLASYSNNTWFSGKVYTYPSGSSDNPNVSGLKEYKYKTTGATTNGANIVANHRSIEAQGTSYIQWMACDNAGNCSSYNTNKTIKLDRTKPSITVTVTSSGGTTNGKYKNNVHIRMSCSDGHSGVKVFKVGGSNASNPTTASKSSRGTLSRTVYCKDDAGNERTVTKTYTVVKEGTSCSYCQCTSYNYYWWSCDRGSDNSLNNCHSTGGGTRNNITCNASNVGKQTSGNGRNFSTCMKGACAGCGPCWY